MKAMFSRFLAVLMVSCLFLTAGISALAVSVDDIYLGNEIHVSPYEQIYIDWSPVYLAFPQFASYINRTQYITVVSDHGVIARYPVKGTACHIPGLPEDDSAYIAFVGIGPETTDALGAFKIFVKEQALEYPSVIINTTNEYYLNFNEGESVYVSFWNSYDDESDNARWWRDNYHHIIEFRRVTDFNDYNGYIKKNGNVYEWGDTYCYEGETGWDVIANASNIYPGQTDFIIGQLPAGKYVAIVSSDMGWQNGHIIAKFNIDVTGKTTQTVQPDITVKVDGKTVWFNVPPQIVNGKLMVSVSEIFSTMGAQVLWEPETQTLKSTKYYAPSGGIIYANFQIGSNIMYTSFGEPAHYIDIAPVMIQGSVMVPVEAAAEAFNYNLNWDKETNIVYIWGQ